MASYETLEDTITITNTHTPETISLTIVKSWDDGDDLYSHRPASIKVGLYKNEDEIIKEIIIDDSWTYTVTDLPTRDENGLIKYSVKELDDNGLAIDTRYDNFYVCSIECSDDNTFIITNKYSSVINCFIEIPDISVY